jgi:hypothetical protein
VTDFCAFANLALSESTSLARFILWPSWLWSKCVCVAGHGWEADLINF